MAAKLAALAGVLFGVLIVALGHGEAPAGVRCLLVAGFMILALFYGFAAFTPSAPRWLSSPPVIGTASILAGSLILWVPPNVVLSAALVGFGCRCLMIEHRKQEEADARGSREIVPRNRQRRSELARREVSHAPADGGSVQAAQPVLRRPARGDLDV